MQIKKELKLQACQDTYIEIRNLSSLRHFVMLYTYIYIYRYIICILYVFSK